MSEGQVLLRVGEAAERLAISRSKLYELIAAGRLPGAMKVGGSIRISARALDAWIASSAKAPDGN